MSSTSLKVSTGVAGLITTPARQPCDLISSRVRCRWTHCFLVHRNPVGARIGERRNVLVGILDHQVTIQRQLGHLAQRLHHRRPDGDVGHEVAVHHVHVQQATRRPRRAACTCSASRAKSADKIEGASSITPHPPFGKTAKVYYSPARPGLRPDGMRSLERVCHLRLICPRRDEMRPAESFRLKRLLRTSSQKT